MNTINKTLLERLFLDTECKTPQREIYLHVKKRIFPNDYEYIHFLQLSDLNEKREIAKKIVKRLCVISNYQPPYELIINVSQQEKVHENQSTTNKYIPQDHFVHVVSTYIFGVFLFFEHPSFSRELNLVFSDKRKGDNYLRKINAVNDFVSSWKSFCLYHDIGYPFEIYFKNGIKLTDDQHKEMEIFDNIFFHLKNQLVNKALAKLIVVNSMIEEAVRNKKFRDVSSILCYKFTSTLKEDRYLVGSEIDNIDEYYELEDIYSFEHFKMFMGFVNEKDVMKVLFSRVLGYPLALSFLGDNEECIYKNIDVTTRLADEELLSFFNNDDTVYNLEYNENYEIKYYVKNLETSFKGNLHERVSRDDLDNILKLVKEEGEIFLDFKHINSEKDLDNLLFEVYEALSKLLKEHLSNFSEQELRDLENCKIKKLYLAIKRFVYKDYVRKDGEMTSEIRNFIADGLINDEDDMQILIDNLSNCSAKRSNFNQHVPKYVESVFNEEGLGKISAHIVEQMVATLQKKIPRRYSFIRVYSLLAKMFDSKSKKIKADACITTDEFNVLSLLHAAKRNDRINKEFSSVEKRILTTKYLQVESIIEKYKSDYTKYDHGICSGAIYMYVNAVSSHFAQEMESDTSGFAKMLIPLFWTINPKMLEQKLLTNYEHVIGEAFSAIFCHNIYPRYINPIFKLKGEKAWNTSIDKEAFLYFCMLCDSLQHWDREKYYDPRKVDYKPLFAMDSYNIHIENDKILIKTTAYTNNYNDIVKEFAFNEFLEDCSKYLSLEIKPR